MRRAPCSKQPSSGDLPAKVHVNQFKASGGVALCVEYGAMSVDHLEVLRAEDVAELATGDTMPVALPLCSLFLDLPFTQGRTLVDAGCALAIATDFNPGSAPSGNMHLAAALGCCAHGVGAHRSIGCGHDQWCSCIGHRNRSGWLGCWSRGESDGDAAPAAR